MPTREGCEITSPLVSPVTSPACHFRVTSSPAVRLHQWSAEQAQNSMTELEQRRTMLAGAIVGPNASYDSAIDSLPDECYCELASSPSLSFRRSPSLSLSQQQRHQDDHSLGHISSLPAASASSTLAGGLQQAQPYQYMASSSPSASISPSYSLLNGPILSNNSNNNSFNHHPSPHSPHYRSLGDYHHRLYNPGHTRLFVSTSSDSVHHSATTLSTVNKCASRHLDTKLQSTSMAVFLDHSIACVRSNYRTTTGALTTTTTTISKSSNRLPDSCPGTHLTGTSAITAPAAHSSRRVATGTDSSSTKNNNNSGRITGSEQQEKKQPSGSSASAASDTEDTYAHLQPACECSRRTDRQQVLPVHSPTAADWTRKSTTSTTSTGTATLSASSASLLRSSRSFTTSYRQRPNVTTCKCFCLPFISLCPQRSALHRSDSLHGHSIERLWQS